MRMEAAAGMQALSANWERLEDTWSSRASSSGAAAQPTPGRQLGETDP